MDATQVRKRFLNLLEDSRRLISEFRLVEDLFKELTRNVKEQKLREAVSKGDILKKFSMPTITWKNPTKGKAIMPYGIF